MQIKRTFISLSVLIFTAVIFLLPAVNVLEVKSRKNSMQHYYSRQAYKDGFVISYTHSVNKGRVHDYYRLCGNKRLELYQTDFVSYGAGIPEAEETPGAVFEVNGDNYSIKNLNRCLDRLVMAVGLIANHSISFGDSREYKMTSLFPAQTSIVFEYKKISLAAYAFGKKIKG